MPKNHAALAQRAASRDRTRHMLLASLLASLLAASAWVQVPIGAVPITLQVFVVLLAGLVLPAGWAAAAIGAYIVLGAVGVPVFAGGLGGLGVLLGPTGGYILGFLMAAPAVALVVRRRAPGASPSSRRALTGALAGVAVIYVAGWLQLMAVTGMAPAPAFVAGVVPFVALDVAKAFAAVAASAGLRAAGVVRR